MKKIVTVTIFALVAVALTGSVALADYGSDNSLSGKVRKYGTKSPLNRAKVKLYETRGGTMLDSDKTNKKGKYSFAGLSERSYVVKVKALKYRSPKKSKKNSSVYKTVSVNGDTTKNIYLKKN